MNSEIEIKGLTKKLVAINLLAQEEALKAYSQAKKKTFLSHITLLRIKF